MAAYEDVKKYPFSISRLERINTQGRDTLGHIFINALRTVHFIYS